MNRRAFLAGSGAVLAGAAGARYLPLVTGDRFEELFAGALGIEVGVATALLAGARERLGDGDYDRRAAQFALAVRGPSSELLPAPVRRRAVASLVNAVVDDVPMALAVGLDRPPATACGGLVRPA